MINLQIDIKLFFNNNKTLNSVRTLWFPSFNKHVWNKQYMLHDTSRYLNINSSVCKQRHKHFTSLKMVGVMVHVSIVLFMYYLVSHKFSETLLQAYYSLFTK